MLKNLLPTGLVYELIPSNSPTINEVDSFIREL
jgi:hypothetical protein